MYPTATNTTEVDVAIICPPQVTPTQVMKSPYKGRRIALKIIFVWSSSGNKEGGAINSNGKKAAINPHEIPPTFTTWKMIIKKSFESRRPMDFDSMFPAGPPFRNLSNKEYH